MGAAARRRGRGTLAEVVASVDVTVPTAVEDVAHVNFPTSGFLIKGAALCHSILCVCSLSCSRFCQKVVFGTILDGRENFSDAKARKLCSSNKNYG